MDSENSAERNISKLVSTSFLGRVYMEVGDPR